MKKTIWLFVLMILTLVACNNNNTQVNETQKDEEVVVMVQPKPELKILNRDLDISVELSEEELAFFKEDQLIPLNDLRGVHRLLFSWDKDVNKLSFVYEDQTIIVDFNAAVYSINGNQDQENDLIINRGNNLYISLDKLSDLFDVTYEFIEDPLTIITVDFDSKDEQDHDVQVQMDSILSQLPNKINMTWEAVYSAKTNVSKLYDMPGLHVISPVWYDLEDGSGKVKSKKQDDYILWADSKAYDLWPAITNGFNPDWTHDLVHDIDNRTAFIEKMVNIYKTNGFPGMNIDFENIYKDDKEALSQFIAELSAACHRQGIIISMDVTFAGGSDNWSKCYDRKILGQWVDFICIMSYDEHWGSSPVSGSVASINWLDRNLALLVEEVEPNKVIMGIPFYMRVWFERPHKEIVNNMKVTSDAITMHAMEKMLQSGNYNVLWDEAAGQNYISFIDAKDNAVKKIWIEDAESLKVKLTMVHKYQLKGIASWRRGYELESIWPMLDIELNR